MPQKKIELVMFDLDGTLVDAFGPVTASLNHMFTEIGYPRIDRATVKRNVGWGETSLVRSFVDEELVEKALTIYRRHHSKALRKGVKFLPGAKRLLNRLNKDNVRLAIASNRPSRFTKIILRELGVYRMFADVWCADQAGEKKPHPKIIKDILARQGVRPSRALYVGDMTIDAHAGRRARVSTVVVTTGSSTHQELKEAKPVQIVHNVYDVVNYIG